MPKSLVVPFAAAAAGRALRAVIPIAAACAALTPGAWAQPAQPSPACDSALVTSVPEDQLLAACTAIIERDPSAIAYMKAAARDCEKGSVEALVASAELKRLGQ